MNQAKFMEVGDLFYMLPLIVIAVGALCVVLFDSFVSQKAKSGIATVASLFGILTALTAVFLAKEIGDESRYLLHNMLIADRLAYAIIALCAGVVAIVALLAKVEQEIHRWVQGETYSLLLFAGAGLAVIAMSADLVSLFIGIETMSLAVYALVASRRHHKKSMEASMKYFIAGAFASGILVFGIALLYGATGETSFAHINVVLDRGIDQMSAEMLSIAVVGTLLCVAAFAFKIAAVPFHMWTPDAYEGAPSSVTAFMASAVKVGAVVGMIRLFTWALGGDVMPWGYMGWADPMAIMAALTMTIANIAALRQTNIKRMLAYSSISHAGLLLLGVISEGLGAPSALGNVVFYLFAYSIMTLGVFAVVIHVSSDGKERNLISDFAGLGKANPGMALAMTLLLLSLAGIPPTGGFLAKFGVLMSGVEVYDQQLLWLVIVGAINSAISIYYYLKVVMTMYFKPAEQDLAFPARPVLVNLVIICTVAVLLMGVLPGVFKIL